jgi:hypothetical protein
LRRIWKRKLPDRDPFQDLIDAGVVDRTEKIIRTGTFGIFKPINEAQAKAWEDRRNGVPRLPKKLRRQQRKVSDAGD